MKKPHELGLLFAFFEWIFTPLGQCEKYIESGVNDGKKSEAHKSAVVGDTVGDSFKDTAGPSLYVLIKLLATITLVLVAFFI